MIIEIYRYDLERRKAMSRLCKKCGNEVKMEDQFCMHCGMPLEKEESVREEESKSQNQGAVLSMWDYVLMMILMAIPVVNIVVCILWIISKNGNPNRRNFAKAWLQKNTHVVQQLVETPKIKGTKGKKAKCPDCDKP